jgi:hypothetical protein
MSGVSVLGSKILAPHGASLLRMNATIVGASPIEFRKCAVGAGRDLPVFAALTRRELELELWPRDISESLQRIRP